MTTSLARGTAASRVAALASAVDELLDITTGELEGLQPSEFAELIVSLERQRRRLDAVDVQVLAAAHQAHLAAQHCRSSLADLLVHELRVNPGVARARVRRAVDLGPRWALSGERLDPIHPQLAAALTAGDISTQHVDVATAVLSRVPAELGGRTCTEAEALLVTSARHETPCAMGRTGHRLLQRLDPDGSAPNEDRVHALRRLRLHRRPDSSWTLTGELTEDTGLVWQTILDTLAAPAPAENGERDPRTPEQRTHDGLRDLGIRLLRSGIPTGDGHTPVTILIRTTETDLATPNGLAQTEHGHLVRMASLQALCGDAELVPLAFDRAWSDHQLMLGRSARLASRAQRRALTVRDGGCSFPGCDRPASWSEAHHIQPWQDGGRTDIDNLCLLCGFHHREFERRGWAVAMIDGLPWWTPPVWIDPDQTPRRNQAHHLPDITFDSDGTIRALLRDTDPPHRR